MSVSVGAQPVDGEANSELVKFMAKQLQIRKSDVSIEKVNFKIIILHVYSKVCGCVEVDKNQLVPWQYGGLG